MEHMTVCYKSGKRIESPVSRVEWDRNEPELLYWPDTGEAHCVARDAITGAYITSDRGATVASIPGLSPDVSVDYEGVR